MVSAYWIRDELLPFACEVQHITADFCEMKRESGTLWGG